MLDCLLSFRKARNTSGAKRLALRSLLNMASNWGFGGEVNLPEGKISGPIRFAPNLVYRKVNDFLNKKIRH
jgi:hypothetical protein